MYLEIKSYLDELPTELHTFAREKPLIINNKYKNKRGQAASVSPVNGPVHKS